MNIYIINLRKKIGALVNLVLQIVLGNQMQVGRRKFSFAITSSFAERFKAL